jgi:hypothetical protein
MLRAVFLFPPNADVEADRVPVVGEVGEIKLAAVGDEPHEKQKEDVG